MTWTRRRTAYVFLRNLGPPMNLLMGYWLGVGLPLVAIATLATYLVNQAVVDYLFLTIQDETHRETRKRLEASVTK